jgi:hypothetical protein
VLVFSLAHVSTGEAAPKRQLPVINASYAERAVEPTHFSPTDIADRLTPTQLSNYVRGITWSSWGGSTAVGQGQVTLLNGTNESSPVTVRLGGLGTCAGVEVYSTYSLELGRGASRPELWPEGQTGKFPCDIWLAGTTGGTFQGSTTHRGHAAFAGIQLDHESRFPRGGGQAGLVPFKPPLPMSKVAPQVNFYRMQWNAWGGPSITGSGYMGALTQRHRDRRYWPAKLELSHPTWCPAAGQEEPFAAAITYGEFKVILFGGPRELVEHQVPDSVFHEYFGARHVYRQRLHPTQAACWLGAVNDAPEALREPEKMYGPFPDT